MPLALRGSAPASNYAPSAIPEASSDFMDRVAKLYAEDDQLAGLYAKALETRAMAGDDGLKNLRDAKKAGELAASLMREDDGARIAMIELEGWDTHANQRGSFARPARQLDALLGAYSKSMGSAWDNTLVLVATEFGRTARYNGTGLYQNRDLRPTSALESVLGGAAAEHFGLDPARAMASLFPGRSDPALNGLIRRS